jgi:hypothetical protein
MLLINYDIIDPEEDNIEEQVEIPEEELNLNDFGDPNSKTELWVGPEGPLLLRTETEDNEVIELYGLRDFNGVPYNSM